MKLKDILSESPFYNRVVFSSAAFLKELPEKFTVLSSDSGYLFFGSSFAAKSKSFPIVLSDNADAESVIKATREERGLIVAVGKGKFISYCRAAAKINCFSLVAVFTDLTFAYAFTPTVEYLFKGGLIKAGCALPEKVLIDVKKLSTLKKGALADGFAFSASLLSATPIQDISFANCVLEAVNALILVKNDPFASIVKANLFAAKAAFNGSFYSDSYFVGLILSLLSDNGEEECAFFASEYVLKLYPLIKNNDFSRILCLPDYLAPVDFLAEITGGSAGQIFSSFSPFSDEEVLLSIAAIKQKIADNEVIEGLLAKLRSLKRAYSFVYNGRKKRSEVKKEQFLKSVRLAGVYSDGVLKTLLSGGFDFFI
ncbi:MAG TPA: hypothetical protein DDY77_03830 [Clostridiales bacterium]|nr:hypothetical protein [Clostridiales bacterium]